MKCTCLGVTYSPVEQEGDPMHYYLRTLEMDCSNIITCIKQESCKNRQNTGMQS